MKLFASTSIRGKITLAITALSALTVAISALFAYHLLMQEKLETIETAYRANLQSRIPDVHYRFDAIDQELLTLASLPPIAGLGRAYNNNGFDDQDQSTTAQWLQRLQIIFISILKKNEHFFQIRLIAADEKGMELVRVERTADGSIQATKDLQAKASEPYFQESLALTQGNVYHSQITLNREHGKVDPRRIPTFRSATTLVDENDRVFAILVINVDYRKTLLQLNDTLSSNQETRIMDNQGNVFISHPDLQKSAFFFKEDLSEREQTLNQKILASPAFRVFNTTDPSSSSSSSLMIVTSPPIAVSGNNLVLAISILEDRNSLLAPLHHYQQKLLMSGALFVVAMATIAFLVSRSITKPLMQSIASIGDYAQHGNQLKLPDFKDIELSTLVNNVECALQREAESHQARQTALQGYEAIFQTVVDALVTIDNHGIIQTVNPAALEMFGYRTDELIGQNVKILVPEPHRSQHDHYIENYNHTNKARLIGKSRELTGQRKDGATFPVQLTLAESSNNQKFRFLGIIADISERKEKENRILSLIQDLEKSNRELDDFAYIASHDLREPMRGIQLLAQKMVTKYGDILDVDGIKRLHRMMTLSERMHDLVADLLFYSRLGRATAELTKVDLNQLVLDIKDSHQDYLQEKNAEVIIKKHLPALMCDRNKAHSIFTNLITNGVKYNDAHLKHIEIEIFESMQHENVRFRNVFSIRDNGIGIEPEFHEQIFRMFKRLNREDAYGYGTGAGLTFVKKAIEQHGGQIWLTSTPGSGTCFMFSLSPGTPITAIKKDEEKTIETPTPTSQQESMYG